MSCSCKRAQKLEQEHGVPQEESLLTKFIRYGFKIFFFVIAIVITAIAVPYVMFYAIYSMFFGDNKITLPKFLRKYLE
jgi:hypothetical protein